MDRFVAGAFLALALTFSIVVAGCVNGGGAWAFTINGDSAKVVNGSLYARLANCNITVNDTNGVPLEEFLYYYGVYPVTSVSIDGRTYNWSGLAAAVPFDVPVLVLPNGNVFDGAQVLRASNINVMTAEKPAHSSLEIEPSMLYALGLGEDEGLIRSKSDRVVLFYVDALGYGRYEQARGRGLINNITSLGEPERLACVYPSVSIVNSKTLVTGLPPNAILGDFDSYFPNGPTIFDKAAAGRLNAVWVDGKTAPVSLGGYTVNRPDADKNGYEADDVASAAIQEYATGADLLFVHFKDTDAIAHDHGPYAEPSFDALAFVDGQIGRILRTLRPGTLVIVYADHGGHTVLDNFGNHGTLIPEDMYVPFVAHVV